MSIKIENLTYVYMPKTPFEKKALDNVSLEIEDGEFLAVIGHTGSGKSTLIQHLNGLLKPASGKIYVDGTDITDKDTKLVDIRKKVGLVFQYPEYQLFEETIAKDIAYGPTNLGLNEDEILRRVKKSMEMVGLDYDEYKDISPFELSGGQKRRVAIAGVIAMEPNVLILGLAVPQVTYLMRALKRKGFNVSEDIFTVEKAKSELLNILLKNK